MTFETQHGSVKHFYKDSVVLITGGTGFLGKVLIEKLLRVFDVRKIYILIRFKNNMNANDRLAALFNESVFDRLRETDPEAFNKVTAISSDFTAEHLGMDEDSRKVIKAEVEIIFNIVASVKFNEKLKDAIEINILGTQKVMQLTNEIENLKAFLHISTLYTSCNRKHIDEKIYEMEIGYQKLIQIGRTLNRNDLEKIKHCLLDDMPNTYTMTKRCAEIMVFKEAGCRPYGIFRPPIVISTYKEPLPGWTDNVYGPSGVCLWALKGIIHVIWGNENCYANMVPIDYCINAMVCAAWDTSYRFKEALANEKSLEVPVYNYLYAENNLTWGKYMKSARLGLHQPLEKAVWYYSYTIQSTEIGFKTFSFLYHTLPGYCLDALAFITGRPMVYTHSYRKLVRQLHYFSHFGLLRWSCSNSNVQKMHRRLTNNERNQLEFDMKTVDWKQYFRNYVPGIKRYYCQEDMSKLALCKTKYLKLKLLHQFTKFIFWLFIILKISKMTFKKIFKLIARHV